MAENKPKIEKATFAAGCFWGVEAAFSNVLGVLETTVGYTGGRTANPTYKDVCSGQTGHAEAVAIKFNPAIVSYDKLLDIFWRSHNPTTPNQQGPDIGEQYRSAIFFHNKEQEKAAHLSKAKLEKSGKYNSRIMTEIVSAKKFWKAEDYHQHYFAKTGQAACY